MTRRWGSLAGRLSFQFSQIELRWARLCFGGSEAAMIVRSIVFLLLTLIAELTASWQVWGGAPTDTLRVAYPGFWSYEVGRVLCWAILSTICLAVGLIMWRSSSWAIRNKSEQRFSLLQVGTAQLLALTLEISTSVWYWSMKSSR